MAHEFYIANKDNYIGTNFSDIAKQCFGYANAMQAEADKCNKAEAEQKRKEMRELLNANNTFLEKEGQHFDDVEWQPDWSQAPDFASKWVMVSADRADWVSEDNADWCKAPSFDYQGDWRNSLRKRPVID